MNVLRARMAASSSTQAYLFLRKSSTGSGSNSAYLGAIVNTHKLVMLFRALAWSDPMLNIASSLLVEDRSWIRF